MTFQEFIHVDAAIYFCYSQLECLCSPINLPIKPVACLSVFSARVLIWTSLECLSQFFLSLTWSPPNSLSAAAQPSLCHSEVFFMFYDSCMDAHTYTFFTHSTLCHLLKTVGSGYGLSPPLCYHSPVPLLSVSQLGPLSCIWNPLSACMCEEYRVNVSSPRPYVIMKLWAFCLSFVWQYPSHILSLLYIDISIAKFLYSKHLCVFAWAQAHRIVWEFLVFMI